jgi:hypothetical protein
MACSTTWHILTTTIGTLKQLYERFNPHINETFLNLYRETFRTVCNFSNAYKLLLNHQQISSVVPLNIHAGLCMQVL